MGCLKLTYRSETPTLKVVWNSLKDNEKGCAGVYRFGFQGMEADDEISGSKSHYTAQYWMYDSRIGRRWETDPVTYPWQSTYACFNNNPIYYTDPLCLFGTKKEARQYKRENNVKGKINKNDDGSFSIDNNKEHFSIFNDQEYGVVTAALVTAQGPKVGNTGRDDRHEDGRRRWRGRNYNRGINFSPFDERGREILGRWLDGTGDPLRVQNGKWGDYMRDNDLLRNQITSILEDDAQTRTESGDFSYQGWAEIENGYLTGYEMLHGTDATVGGFQIRGTVKVVDDKTIEYRVKITWNDIIDPNPTYQDDVTLSNALERVYNPQDYEIHIMWDDTFTITK